MSRRQPVLPAGIDRWADLAGIFLLALATLLFEVTLTRIFSFVVWSNYAFLIVSTALLGFGMAGVTLSLMAEDSPWRRPQRVGLYSLAFALGAIAALWIIIEVPLVVDQFHRAVNWLYLLIVYVAIILPFFFAGLAISILLSADSKRVHRLYFWDLVGAAVGALLLSFIIIPIGASGAVLLAAGTGLLAAWIFTVSHGSRWHYLVLPLSLAVLATVPAGERLFTIKAHQSKRWFKSVENNSLFSGWSTLSKIDVVSYDQGTRREIFINGGENESYLATLDPNPHWEDPSNFAYLFVGGYAHRFVGGPVRRPRVMIIGSSGGTEVAFALAHKAEVVHAVEMDPLICRIVAEDMADWNKGMYHLPQVRQFNDEGRSFIANREETYDLILMRNNFTPIAFASGAINLSETYLLTVEGFRRYLERLSDDGILGIMRWGTIRLCTTMRQVADEAGIDRLGDHVMILSGDWWGQHGFYFKKSPFTEQEVAFAKKYAETRGRRLLYYPGMAADASLYARVLLDPGYRRYFDFAGFDLRPATDDHPFFDHFLRLGRPVAIDAPGVPEELHHIGQMLAWQPPGWLQPFLGRLAISKYEVPVLAIAVESVLVCFLGVFLPMFAHTRRRRETPRVSLSLFLYFSILGLAFIMVELCFIKQYILFLGHPAYSISLIIACLLVFSGIGSALSERFGRRPARALYAVFAVIFLLLTATLYGMPMVFSALLGRPLWVRVLATCCMIAPLGIAMGMPFPLGLRLVHRISSGLVGWAWGINGFMTVIGSILTIVVSLALGFTAVLWTAAWLYLGGTVAAFFLARRAAGRAPTP